jgi:hypothetical protein
VVVWAILFLPLNYGIIQPTLNNIVNISDSAFSEYSMEKQQLLELSDIIVLGSLI